MWQIGPWIEPDHIACLLVKLPAKKEDRKLLLNFRHLKNLWYCRADDIVQNRSLQAFTHTLSLEYPRGCDDCKGSTMRA